MTRDDIHGLLFRFLSEGELLDEQLQAQHQIAAYKDSMNVWRSILQRQVNKEKTYIDLEAGYGGYFDRVRLWAERYLSEAMRDSDCLCGCRSSAPMEGYIGSVGWLGVVFDDTKLPLGLELVPPPWQRRPSKFWLDPK
jgi:hypothetical protein